jgi:hypothetical protein
MDALAYSHRRADVNAVNSVLVDQLHELLAEHAVTNGLASESSLRVAASMLARAPSDDVTATRVVGVLGRDDQDAFMSLVDAIADEYGIESHVRLNGGSFSVRFSRY